MSFGSYALSLTMEQVLANAYATIILVAAAGNDGIYVDQCIPSGPFYPAALSFVLGVQAPDGAFSNTDCNGPTFSATPDLLNYEMKAPGTNIISTIPNGNYRVYQGTSMAAPIVSGSLAMYRPLRPEESMELMWVKLIQSTSDFLNIEEALNKVPASEVRLISQTMIDTLTGDDNDGRVDAGETIQFWFTARNTGGQCDSTWFKLRFHEFEDTTTAQIIKPISFIGNMSPYASRTSQFDPMKLHISPNVANDRDIIFDLLFWFKGCADTTIQEVILNVTNGEELSGVMDSTLILTPDKLWLVNQSFRIHYNGLLIILPGTHLILNQNIAIRGIVHGIGKPDSLINITGPGSFVDGGNGHGDYTGKLKFAYTYFYGINNAFTADSISFTNCIIEENTYGNSISSYIFYASRYLFLKDNAIKNSIFTTICIWTPGTREVNRNNFYNCIMGQTSYSTCDRVPQHYNNYVKMRGDGRLFVISQTPPYFNNLISFDSGLFPFYANGSSGTVNISNQYWGTTNLNKIKAMNYDFFKDPNLPMFTYNPILTAPSDSAHAVTWKILVNGKDAQDEYVDPVGVGPQRFDVYFNREMDTTYTPQLTFGVRYPYTQQPVADSGRWDATHQIWTAYKTIKLYTGDGINRLRVAGAKEANGWEWEIPVEDSRFEFLINAAGSSSMDFTATPGLGKVKLEWNNADIEDLLGFNMYRFQNITDTTFTSPILINTELITDTLFTDFNVTPGTHYYYYYKVVRTDFAESDSSHIVNAIPVTASAGDANGDLAVNVLDITTIISYLLNQNPQPFIFEAADVNSDNSVNVLDVIGVVNLITGHKKSISNVVGANAVPAYIYLKPDKIKFRSDAQVAGLQFTLKGSNLKEVKLSSLVDGFEFAYTASDTVITGILFSFSGKTIPAGLQDILHIEAGNAILNWGDVTGGDKKGQYVTIIKAGEILPVPSDYSLKAYPNPTSGEMTLSFDLPENAKVNISIYNLYGQLVTRLQDATLNYGNHQLHWQAPKAGVYICSMQATATEAKKARYAKDIKLIVIK